MQISASKFKAIQAFIVMGVPFIWYFWLSAMIPFEFAVFSLLTLMGILAFLKLELLTYMTLSGINSLHEHLSHMERGEDGGTEISRIQLDPSDTLGSLMKVKEALERAKKDIKETE